MSSDRWATSPTEGQSSGERREMYERLTEFVQRVARVGDALPRTRAGGVISLRITRASDSVDAHYREGARPKSAADRISKLESALQQLEVTQYWLEIIGDAGLIAAHRLEPLYREAGELMAIIVSMVKKQKAKG